MDWLTMWFAEMALRVDETMQPTGRGDDGFAPDTLAMVAFGWATPAHEPVACRERWQQAMIALDAFLETHDLWLTPTAAGPPMRIGQLDTPTVQRTALRVALRLQAERLLLRTRLLEQPAIGSLRHTPFTQVANITGVPAMSVPLHSCDETSDAPGLPIGSQFVGDHGDEGPRCRSRSSWSRRPLERSCAGLASPQSHLGPSACIATPRVVHQHARHDHVDQARDTARRGVAVPLSI